jgi:hypothetical protein
LLVWVVALIFVAAGAFNTWAAFNINTGERDHDAFKIGGGLGPPTPAAAMCAATPTIVVPVSRSDGR